MKPVTGVVTRDFHIRTATMEISILQGTELDLIDARISDKTSSGIIVTASVSNFDGVRLTFDMCSSLLAPNE